MNRIIAVNSNCYHGFTIEEAIQGKLASGFVSMGADVGVITLGEWGGTYGDKLSAEQKDTLQKLWEQARDGVDLMSLAK